MAWIAGIGIAVSAAFGATAVSGLTAMVVGGVVVGAAVGGLYSAVTGGNILKGVLYGAVGGAVVGAGGYALGFGEVAAGGGTMGAATTASGSQLSGTLGAEELGAQLGGAEISISGGIGSGATGGEGFGAALFTKDGIGFLGGAASLGAAFLNGGAAGDLGKDQIESNEKITSEKLAAEKEMAAANNKTALAVAGMQAESAARARESQERIAANELAFGKEKFGKEFDESQWRDRDDRKTVETAKREFAEGITEASKYVAGSTQVVSLVESNRRRNELPSPSWYDRNATTTTVASNQPAAQTPAQSTGILGA